MIVEPRPHWIMNKEGEEVTMQITYTGLCPHCNDPLDDHSGTQGFKRPCLGCEHKGGPCR